MRILRKSSPIYSLFLKRFQKQYGDVAELTKLYLNKEKKVYAGEWKDSEGVVNFNGGFAIDLEETIEVLRGG